MNIFVTGATGFVGKALIENLLSELYEVKALVRQSSEALPLAVEQVIVGDLAYLTLCNSSGSLGETFKNTEVIVHTAARVHVMNDNASNPSSE